MPVLMSNICVAVGITPGTPHWGMEFGAAAPAVDVCQALHTSGAVGF